MNEHTPEMITATELSAKLAHLSAELGRAKLRGILVVPEGAMRWLTGMRHQIVDIAPDAPSPVSALIETTASGLAITFVTTRYELPRVRDRTPEVFAGQPGVRVDCRETMPAIGSGVLTPQDPSYREVLGRIVRPLVGGLEGDQFRKLSWLAAGATAALAESAHSLTPGMDGVAVRAEAFRSLAARKIECNLILVALEGQERHLHPLYESRYRIGKDCWVKLVTGARYAELIVSATVMVKFGSRPSAEASRAYAALQRATIEYADCYRAGAVEGEIYAEIGRRFKRLASETGVPQLADSAYVHHPGGPTSPIGNRDYLLEAGGTRAMFPWMQFAINPVEIVTNTKAEVQGVVRPEGPPLVLDCSTGVSRGQLSFTEIAAAGGTRGKVADIIQR